MKVTRKGQVTIPRHIRKQADFLPDCDVVFTCGKGGRVYIQPVLDQRAQSRERVLMECGGIDTALAGPPRAKAASRPPHSIKGRISAHCRLGRGEALVAKLRGRGRVCMTTDEILGLMRGKR